MSLNPLELIVFCHDLSIKCVFLNYSLFLRCVSGLIDYFLRPLTETKNRNQNLFLRTEPRIALINFLESEPEVFFVKGKYHGILVWRGDCICHTLLDMVMDNYHLSIRSISLEKRDILSF